MIERRGARPDAPEIAPRCVPRYEVRHTSMSDLGERSRRDLTISTHQATSGFVIRPSLIASQMRYSSVPPTSPRRTIILMFGFAS